MTDLISAVSDTDDPALDLPTVLFVDDEPGVLDGLKLSVRPLRNELSFCFAGGMAEALEIFAERPIDVLVSDIRMRGGHGDELLRAVRDQYPTTVRYVLSGEAESDMVMRAMLIAHRWLSKPCSREDLTAALRSAVRYRNVVAGPNLAVHVAGADALPALPDRYWQITELLSSETSNAGQIAEVAEGDPVMAAKLLQLANSAAAGRGEVKDVKGAVARIGLAAVGRLLLSIEVLRPFENPDPIPGFPVDEMQTFGERVGVMASKLALPEYLTTARIGGLLTHLGLLIEASVVPDLLREAYDLADRRGMQIKDAQIELDGVSHPALAGHLMSIWGLPTDLVIAVFDSYMPMPTGMEPPFSAGQAIRAARLIIKQQMGDRLGEPFRDRLSEEEQHDLGVWVEWLNQQDES
ncbi:MAG: HDOD domain-containing protein [Actinomycetota bacterium]